MLQPHGAHRLPEDILVGSPLPTSLVFAAQSSESVYQHPDII